MLVRHVLSLPQFRDLEPFEWELGSFEIEKHIIGNETIIKLTQKVNGIRVLGTEISLSLHNTTGEWTWARLNTGNKRLQKRQFGSLPSLDFTVSLTDVLGTLGPLLPPNVDPNTIYAEKVLIALPEVSAAWLVYDPQQSVLERTAYFVNAQTGKVFNLIHLATNDQAYVYPPKSSKPQIGTRPSVREIDNVNGTSTANGGFSIRGKDFRSFNTCFAYKCVTSPNTTVPADGSCDLDNVACVDPTPDMVLGRDYFTVNTTATYDAKLIDFWRDWAAEGYTGATIHVKWTNGTVFAPRLRKPDSGIWGSDIDFASYSTKDFTDSFSELQTYAYLTEHLGFLRELINDPTFCLIGSGPDCATIDPNTGLRADKNNYPMPFIVNLQQPGIDQSSFFDQLRSGKGKTVSNPILFPRFEGMGNAYFMRTITQKPLTNCTEGACVGTSKFQSSYLGFGQWFFDISLDNCIVFHELGHALVQKYIPLLPAYKRNTHGFVSVEPGALHEAWADYFAMINCGASGDWRTTASGIVTRNLNNQLTCQDFTGFHHYDSQIFSGALWAVRQTIGSGSSNEQRALDRAVLKALSTGKLTDDFSTQMGTILVLMKQDASLQPYASKAEEIFLERMLNCAQYIRVDKQTRLSIPNGAIPMATAPSAIRLFPKPSDWSVTLSWSQLVSIPSGQILTTGYAKEPINWAVARDCPLSIVGYTPYQNCSEVRLPLEWSPAGYDNLTGFTTFTTSFAVDAKFLEVAIYNPLTASLVLEYFSVSFFGLTQIWLMVLIALGFIQLIYTLFHEFWLLAAKIHTLFAQRKNDRILEETKSKTKDGSNTELEAAPHTEPNTEQSDVPEWVKRIQKSNPSRARIFIHIRITCFVWCIVGAAGLVGLYAKPSPTTLPWVAFVFVPLLTICDYFFKARLESTLDSSTLMSAIQGLDWTIYSSCFLAASSMAALGVTYSPNSGTVAHGIAFGCFLFAILSREFFLVRIRNIVRRS